MRAGRAGERKQEGQLAPARCSHAQGGGCGGADPRSCEAMPDSKMPIRREALESLSALTVYISRGGHIEGSSRLLPRGQSRLYTREGFLSFSRYFFSDGEQDLAAFADRFERCSTRNRCIMHPLHRLSDPRFILRENLWFAIGWSQRQLSQ